MTKKELMNALENFDDDQYIYVCLHGTDNPFGSTAVQIIIQGVKTIKPWYPGPKNLIGLITHVQNIEVESV